MDITLTRVLTWGLNNLSVDTPFKNEELPANIWLNNIAMAIKNNKLINFNELTPTQAYELGFRKWDEEDNLYLIPLWLYKALPDGLEVTSIDGDKLIVGKDYLDNDIRFGVLAFGIKLKEEEQ